MNKLFEFLEKYLMGPMGKVSTWRPVRAIVAAGMASIPFTIVGSAFLVLSVIPQAFNIQFIVDLWGNSFDKIQALYLLAYKCTMGILSLYFAVVIGYEYTKIYVEEEGLNLNPLNGGLLAVFAYFLTIPELTYSKGMISAVTGKTTIGGWTIGGDSLTRLSTSGMFTAILISILAVQLYRLCVKKNWVIKMPEAVPEGVARSFTALIPGFVIAFVVLLINGIFILFGTDIYKVIAIPFAFVSHITNTWLGIVVIYLLVHALWIVGIHGANIVMGLVNPILLANMAQNVDGKFIAYAGEFTNSYVTIGGSGATLLLCFYIAFRAKSDQLRMLGKAAMGPAIFNINEPLIFGLPIVYNPILTVPFILAPIVSASIGYWSVQLGLAGKAIAQTPWPTPIGIGAYVGSGGNLGAFVVALICALAAFVIWYPFIKMYDTKLYKEEMNGAEAIQ
ncbi:PTS cellobiose transporter subunit IIC [Streptococcus constellatus subsp. pharyngis]|uniref:Permease IIC component n=1 Tax=Streptococcus constellatus subsp. pharyngis SK1060 = CCUG 46377 TaxID=1035184 RepID=F9P532_STRCV|nr:PTS cellobiose transporter subunit IIC [Streptococcus constellatus]AGU72442.1 putative phosphotransferase (PTS) system [Streptococcus constellatus subsp. pharyngis C232]AGU74198.1 putative phosphotransferase (PTS) system [Streptococcus constellatus subsp. pharyngis C818]AGU79566.1 putative phosphotransferase (PTS) system [Streptococcus constellatus subsp. pharyngis C1050]EGV11011.1 PTS system, cellobiose-specific IIC component [Streptococcus constellatus subsp. pharyngis SK1060 = CCUG 46377]